MTVVGQPDVAYTYEDADRLTNITRDTLGVALAYDEANRRTSMTLPNGIVTEYAYDDAKQLTSFTYLNGQARLGDLTEARAHRETSAARHGRGRRRQAATSTVA